jgi:hypothetical protein
VILYDEFMILFSYTSTASSTRATATVAEPVTVEVQATATGIITSGPINPMRVILKLDNTKISSAESNVLSGGALNLIAAAETSVGMSPGKAYTFEVTGLPPANGRLQSVSLKATVVELGQTRRDAGVAGVTRVDSPVAAAGPRVKRRKSG